MRDFRIPQVLAAVRFIVESRVPAVFIETSVNPRIIERVQADGTCWLSGTTWHGMAAFRIAISNWSTTREDIDRSADAILQSIADEHGLHGDDRATLYSSTEFKKIRLHYFTPDYAAWEQEHAGD